MSNSHREMTTPEDTLQDLARQGQALYATIRARLEPEHNNRFVAIHVDTEDYEVARSSAQATRAIQTRHPLDGRLYIRKIGAEPEYGLAARLLAGEMAAQK